MSVQLRIGDVVLVNINNNRADDTTESTEDNVIGIIKYIGYIHSHAMTEYAGLELVESLENGHNGTINGHQYFDCPEGHGMHTRITNVVRKLEASEVTIKMRQIINVFRSRLDQYVQALSQRDEYIERLKNKQRYLRQLLDESKALHQHLNVDYNPEPSKSYIMRVESPSYSSVNTQNIILFNPQNELDEFPPSIATKKNMFKTKDTANNTSLNLMAITPLSVTPRSLSPSPPTFDKNKKIYIFPAKTVIPSKDTSPSKGDLISLNLIDDNTFPDTEQLKYDDSSKGSVLYLHSAEYPKYTDIKSTKTEWSEYDLRDKYAEDSCSFDDDYDDSHIYSPYSKHTKNESSHSLNIYINKNKSPKMVQSKSYKQPRRIHTKNTEPECISDKLPNIVHPKSYSADIDLEQLPSIPFQGPRIQYAYSHITHKQMQQQMVNMNQNNVRVPMASLYLQHQPQFVSSSQQNDIAAIPESYPNSPQKIHAMFKHSIFDRQDHVDSKSKCKRRPSIPSNKYIHHNVLCEQQPQQFYPTQYVMVNNPYYCQQQQQ